MQAPNTSLLALLLTSTLSAGLHGQQVEQYSLSDDDVAIYNLVGEFRVEAGSGEKVTVQITRGGADAGKLKVAQGELDGRETLRLLYPSDRIRYGSLSEGTSTRMRVRDDGTFGDEESRKGSRGRNVTIASRDGGLDAHANLRVLVPSGRQVAIYVGVGKVAVTNVNGDLRVDAASAPVTASGTRGQLDIDVGSGSVQVTQADGDLSVDTGSGSVDVSKISGGVLSIDTGSGSVTAADLKGTELTINTGSGNIGVSGVTIPQVSLEAGSGAVTADLKGDPREVSVETGSGDITLKVPPTVGAELEIQTSSGEIETDFPVLVTRHARDHLTGRIGDGKGKISVETGSGGVKLVKGS
jgi:lia operon protein LiaG